MPYRPVGTVVLVTLGMLMAPRGSAAQPPKQVAQVGILFPSLSVTRPSCRHLNSVCRRWGIARATTSPSSSVRAEGQSEGLPALAAELTQLPVDVLVAAAYEDTLRAARQATNSIHNDCRHAAGHVDARLQQDMSCR